MQSLEDHPFAVFMAGESYESPNERAWLRWVRRVESLLGHSLDGNEREDGYSLDYAHDSFCAGDSPEAYAAEVSSHPNYRGA